MADQRHVRCVARIQVLDQACLARIFSFLTPMPDRFNAAGVCRSWRKLASDPGMQLRVDATSGLQQLTGVFSSIQEAVRVARPGDTIVINAGEYEASNIHINKPLCLVGNGAAPEDTVLHCPQGFECALEFSASGRVANLTVKAELGSCLLHRKGTLTVESCALICGEHPLEHLSFPIVSTADAVPCGQTEEACYKCEDLPLTHFSFPIVSTAPPCCETKAVNGVSVVETRIEGGARAIKTSGNQVLRQVRVMYTRAALTFWFLVSQQLTDISDS